MPLAMLLCQRVCRSITPISGRFGYHHNEKASAFFQEHDVPLYDLPGIPIEVEDMHKAGHPLCKDMPRDVVSIEAAHTHLFSPIRHKEVNASQTDKSKA